MAEGFDPSEAAKALGRAGGLKGGKARAEKLTPEERSEIAREAVETRWARARGITPEDIEKFPKATHKGTLKIGDIEISCFVLGDKRRVLHHRSLVAALGISRGSTGSYSGGDRLVKFVTGGRLKPFMEKKLGAVTDPFLFRTPRGSVAYGYEATVLADICEAVLDAKEADVLQKQQLHIAKRATILHRGFARVGIIGLVDEATGYQVDREKNELRRILEAYISGELLAWAERFPKEFYRELFRLQGWQFDPMSVKRPRMVGKLTKLLIYKKLPLGVLEELEKKNPPVYEKDYRRYKHHQYLTSDIGNVHLEKQVASVTTLMKISPNWETFMRHFERAFPPLEKQQSFLPEDDLSDGTESD